MSNAFDVFYACRLGCLAPPLYKDLRDEMYLGDAMAGGTAAGLLAGGGMGLSGTRGRGCTGPNGRS